MISNILLVDRIGTLKAEVAAQMDELKALEAELKAAGPGRTQGDLFEATVTISERDTLDMKAVREHLSRQFVQAHTVVTAVRTLKVAARSGKALAV